MTAPGRWACRATLAGMRTIILLSVLLALAACGNNAMRNEWDDARDAINKPFK